MRGIEVLIAAGLENRLTAGGGSLVAAGRDGVTDRASGEEIVREATPASIPSSS